MRPASAALWFFRVFPVFWSLPAVAATFGTVAPAPGGGSYSDILLDEPRQRLYLVNSSGNRIDVYSTQSKAFLTAIKTDAQPVSIAMSPDGKTLYATAYSAASLDVIDLTKANVTVSSRVSLPASPEGVAVGGDGRVLISTVGNSGQNVLLVYDPGVPSPNNLSNVAVAPAAPTPPQLPAPSGDTYASYHSRLITSSDGRTIIGADVTSLGGTANRVVFVYEVASATVLRSRTVTNLSNVLSVSPDGAKFMAGSSLFDTATLAIVAQENVANSPFAFPSNSQFSTQTNQGGSVFSPDGSMLYSAFNFAPVQNPPANANVTRLLMNDPDNLLIKLGLQLPESLFGRMVINTAGSTIYALSQSGFITLPLSTLTQAPMARADSQTVLLANDQCGVTAAMNSVMDNIANSGGGRLTVNVQSYTIPTTGVNGVGFGAAEAARSSFCRAAGSSAEGAWLQWAARRLAAGLLGGQPRRQRQAQLPWCRQRQPRVARLSRSSTTHARQLALEQWARTIFSFNLRRQSISRPTSGSMKTTGTQMRGGPSCRCSRISARARA